jgi:uncharacterized integral membrane protein
MSSEAPQPPHQQPRPEPGQGQQPDSGKEGKDRQPKAGPAVPLTRAGALWSSLTLGFLVLIVLLVFITQNPESVPFAFLGWHWRLPLGVAILLAAVGGGLLTVAVGTARIYQLRRAAKRFRARR